MADGMEILDPAQEERLRPIWDEDLDSDVDDPYVVILYNDDVHAMDEVVEQTQIATGYDIERCIRIVLEAHIQGRAIAFTGSEADCERVAGILRQIRLQVETDRF
ncbi:MAG: Clp protease ClpS [Chthonomonadaceae bacterium]|nr:Clp protease ClpS [Chthonomonadaceae bacterium]